MKKIPLMSRRQYPAYEITPLGCALVEAKPKRRDSVMTMFRKFGYCPVTKVFPHSNLIRDFYARK